MPSIQDDIALGISSLTILKPRRYDHGHTQGPLDEENPSAVIAVPLGLVEKSDRQKRAVHCALLMIVLVATVTAVSLSVKAHREVENEQAFSGISKNSGLGLNEDRIASPSGSPLTGYSPSPSGNAPAILALVTFAPVLPISNAPVLAPLAPIETDETSTYTLNNAPSGTPSYYPSYTPSYSPSYSPTSHPSYAPLTLVPTSSSTDDPTTANPTTVPTTLWLANTPAPTEDPTPWLEATPAPTFAWEYPERQTSSPTPVYRQGTNAAGWN